MSMDHLGRADPKKDRRRKQADALEQAIIGHHNEACSEHLFRDGEKFV